jgi:hypothetical protein
MPFKSSARGSYGPQGQKVIKGPLAPVWVTFSPGPVGTGAFSYTFVATDDSGDIPTYSVASGSLPSGLTLNSSTGVLSGTATASGTFTYTLRATDVNGRFADTTSISQVVSLSLYTFTSATFGTGGQTGQDGPNISQARSAVGNPSWASTYLNMNVNGVQRWTVPVTGTYTINCAGAKGGNDGSAGGQGRVITAVGSLTQGEVIYLVVGQPGTDSGGTGGGGGGGGSYVYRGSSEINYQLSDLIVAAGGGSGANNNASNSTGETATFSEGPNFGPSNTGNGGWGNASSGRTVNPNGYGGLVNADNTNGLSSTNNYAGGAGAGFYTRGEGSQDKSGNSGGGGWGGNSGRDTSSNSGGDGQPWRGGQGRNSCHGGFGGGGGSSNDCGGSGGGGGYTGGYAQGCYTVNGSGSSHTAQGFSKSDSGTNNGTGYITITKN